MAEGEIDNLTMEQYLTLTRQNQAPGVVKPKIGGNVSFKIKSQFMRELREDTVSGNQNNDAHENVERYLDIVSLFNIPGVSYDVVMLHIFPITLTRATKRCVVRLSPGNDSSWDLLKKAFIQSLGHDIKKLKENVHVIQVGCQACEGAHLDKDCPLNEEVKSIEEVKYGEFGRSLPFSNGAKYRVGLPRYYMRIDNRPSFGERRTSLEELMNKHLEESTRRRAKMDEWLIKEFHAKTTSEVKNSSFDQCKAVYADKEAPLNNAINEPHEVYFVQEEDLGPSINVIPKSMFEHLKLARLKKTDMLVEMADMTKRAPIGIVENVLIKIDKFLFLSDFVVIDMLNTRNETMILGRLFLATIHAEIDVFNKEISLGIEDDRVTFDIDKKIHNFMTLVGNIYMIKLIHNDESPSHSNASSDKSSRFEKSDDLHNENNYIQEQSSKKTRILKADTNLPSTHFCKPVKQIYNGIDVC
ncbi:reverse transcriptase domain-containing protein [Tanacetum coccineum]